MVQLQELRDAFEFVSAAQGDRELSNAWVDRQTGAVLYGGDCAEDELPEDIDDASRYLEVPDKRDFDLGQPLVWRFVRRQSDELYDEVSACFSRRGAYSRYKDLLETRPAR